MNPYLKTLALGVLLCGCKFDTAGAGAAVGDAVADASQTDGGQSDASSDASEPDATPPSSDTHILLSEIFSDDQGEFIEILNPSEQDVDLTNYFLSDSRDYFLFPQEVAGGLGPHFSQADFLAQFPANSTIAAGTVLIIAVDGKRYKDNFGQNADFAFENAEDTTAMVMRHAAGDKTEISDEGEGIALFFWDGESDLVKDVDLVIVGATPTIENQFETKTNVAVDGPDRGDVPTTYLTETSSLPVFTNAAPAGNSYKRIRLEGEFEIHEGGNGISGDDETSEQIRNTWKQNAFTAPNPGETALN